ncbi:hypothetical protein DYB36_011419 [Aphanomyces astaci]|uniref:Uncharacterized protein n=1 Tax=Aphanomyces astaci TaxID=112090 RepID=A0A397B6T3_APHAT|nr:hypothetical protein DYB36_011419 [Aphanomyces astaci]
MDTTRDIPLALEIQTIEWHDVLHTAAVDAAFDTLVPHGASQRVHFPYLVHHNTLMDLLYYSSPAYGQLVVGAVTTQMNTKYHRFLAHHIQVVIRHPPSDTYLL